jgi:hypothetical protein
MAVRKSAARGGRRCQTAGGEIDPGEPPDGLARAGDEHPRKHEPEKGDQGCDSRHVQRGHAGISLGSKARIATIKRHSRRRLPSQRSRSLDSSALRLLGIDEGREAGVGGGRSTAPQDTLDDELVASRRNSLASDPRAPSRRRTVVSRRDDGSGRGDVTVGRCGPLAERFRSRLCGGRSRCDRQSRRSALEIMRSFYGRPAAQA